MELTPIEVLAVAGNESTYGTSKFATQFGNFFGLHGNGPAGTYYTPTNHVPVMMFPVQNSFLISGNVFVGRVGGFLKPGMGTNPQQFFSILNHHGYATGNSGYANYMTGKNGPYSLVNNCLDGGAQ